MNKNVRNVVMLLIVVVFVFVAVVPQHNVSALTCGVGYVNKKGRCVPIPITSSRATRVVACILRGGGHGTTKQQAEVLLRCYRIK